MGGTAFDLINLQYEQTREGQFLKQMDDDMAVRQKIRMKVLDTLNNGDRNPVNG